MGVSGVRIFSDDNAADLRGDYRQFLSTGMMEPPPRIVCSKNGHPRVKKEAIRAIDDGSALRPWEGSPEIQKRAKVLQETRALLESPQPPPGKIRKRTLATCDWQPGDLIAYRLLSGPFVVFRMLFTHTDQGGVFPECELLDWLGPEPPTEPPPAEIGVRETILYGPDKLLLLLPLGKASVRKKLARDGRLVELGMRHPVPPKPKVPISRVISELDPQLSDYFGLR